MITTSRIQTLANYKQPTKNIFCYVTHEHICKRCYYFRNSPQRSSTQTQWYKCCFMVCLDSPYAYVYYVFQCHRNHCFFSFSQFFKNSAKGSKIQPVNLKIQPLAEFKHSPKFTKNSLAEFRIHWLNFQIHWLNFQIHWLNLKFTGWISKFTGWIKNSLAELNIHQNSPKIHWLNFEFTGWIFKFTGWISPFTGWILGCTYSRGVSHPDWVMVSYQDCIINFL